MYINFSRNLEWKSMETSPKLKQHFVVPILSHQVIKETNIFLPVGPWPLDKRFPVLVAGSVPVQGSLVTW